jgi:hypothetical protein
MRSIFLILSAQSLQLFTIARQPVAEVTLQAVQVRHARAAATIQERKAENPASSARLFL